MKTQYCCTEEREEIAANAAREAERARIDRIAEQQLNTVLRGDDNPDGLVIRERLIQNYFNYPRTDDA